MAGHLARDIYTKYIQEFVNILTSLCPEEPDIFHTNRELEHCQLEIWALLKRVAVPLIRATVRWPHDLATPRNAAAQELARVVPQAYDDFVRKRLNLTPWHLITDFSLLDF